MFWREITEPDLAELFSDHPAAFGAELIGEAAAWRAWHDLLSWPGFNGAAIERELPGRSTERLCFGASVFVSDAFAQKEISHPKPGLNGRVLAEFTNRTANVLGPQRIAEDNASEGLNVLIFFGRTLRRVKEQEAFEANLELATAFVELQAGYRFRRMLVELKDGADVAHALSTRLYALLPHDVAAVPNANNGQTALAVICSEAVFPGSILSSLFHARTPELVLRVTDQELLRAALAGSTDTELASHLGITLAAVKRRWEDIYRTVAASNLPIAAVLNTKSAEGKRGAQKRHILLEYLRQHREELRPFSRKRQASARGAAAF